MAGISHRVPPRMKIMWLSAAQTPPPLLQSASATTVVTRPSAKETFFKTRSLVTVVLKQAAPTNRLVLAKGIRLLLYCVEVLM